MERLARVIGLAPSEMSILELEKAIKEEHSRVSRGLIGGTRATKRKSKQPAKVNVVKSFEKKYGMSLEEMERKLELLKRLEEKGAF